MVLMQRGYQKNKLKSFTQLKTKMDIIKKSCSKKEQDFNKRGKFTIIFI